MNVFNNAILARNRQLPDDDQMIETCRNIFKSFNVNNLSVCIGWCADQVTLRSARCNDKDIDPIFMSQAGQDILDFLALEAWNTDLYRNVGT